MSEGSDALAVLTRVRRRAAARTDPGSDEVCEMCGERLDDGHGHVVDVQSRRLMCACRGCHLLFTSRGAGGGHFVAVPDRCLACDALGGSAEWDALQIPVSVAFFFVNSNLGRVCAFYPGPAGATESLLPLATWERLAAADAVLAGMQPDVEALLVRRADHGRSRPEAYVVPIDWCYELVGEMRRTWRGFDGGQDARRALDDVFARVRERAR